MEGRGNRPARKRKSWENWTRQITHTERSKTGVEKKLKGKEPKEGTKRRLNDEKLGGDKSKGTDTIRQARRKEKIKKKVDGLLPLESVAQKQAAKGGDKSVLRKGGHYGKTKECP